jgi:hypothetical protein
MRCHHGRPGLAVLPAVPPGAGAYPLLGIVGVRGARLCRRYVSQRQRLPAARRGARGAVPRHRRAPRRLPGDEPAAGGRRAAACLRGARVPRLPDLRDPRARLRAPAVRGVRARAAGAVLVQGAGLLPEVRRPAHDRECGSAGGRSAAAGARAPVGAEPAVPAAVFARVGSRAGAAGARRVRARAAGLPAAPRPPPWHPHRAVGLGDGHPALRGRTESQRPFAHAAPRRRVLQGPGRGARVPAPTAADR